MKTYQFNLTMASLPGPVQNLTQSDIIKQGVTFVVVQNEFSGHLSH